MAPQGCKSTIDLLGQHGTSQLVGKRHGGKGEQLVGARPPTGRYLAVTVNPSTFQVMDLGISNQAPPVALKSYGPVLNLTK